MDKFNNDLEIIYCENSRRQELLNSYFILAKGKQHDDATKLVGKFLITVGIPYSNEAVVASLSYLINLREDKLLTLLDNLGFTQEEIDNKLENAYTFNSKLYIKRFEQLIEFIDTNKLLTPFYRTLIKGVNLVGKSLTSWQNSWREHILYKINRELFDLFNGDEDRVYQMLQNDNLLDLRDGKVADRCYSVLVNNDGKYRQKAYSKAFEKEVTEVVTKLNMLIESLRKESDELFNQKDDWLQYFNAVKVAFSGEDVDTLVELWADVDRAWMQIKTPIQVGHPLEYYEDKYRKAVALEWDLRINKPNALSSDFINKSIKKAARDIASEVGGKELIEKNIEQIDQTQLYIGQPMLYYGAELNGLFSAQVVPNDVEVSKEFGKKIFAYIDFVRESKKSKPIMQLSVDVFGKEFIQKEKELIETNQILWNKIYYISTIGHEFGHILWIDDDTEVEMNNSGVFKNIEEFKATTGGVMAFFANEESELIEPLLNDIVSRAVSLISWQEVGEVLPYYCEGLIHLELLFKSQIIDFKEGRVAIDYSNYNEFKTQYTAAYQELASHYLSKKDAKEYLNIYTTKENNIYLPKTQKIKEFVQDYYTRYREIGNEVAKDFMQ